MNAEPATVTADNDLPAVRRDGWFFVWLATGAFALSAVLYWLAKGEATQTNPLAILAVLMVSGAAFCFAYAAFKFVTAFRAGAQSLSVVAPLVISASLGACGLALLVGRRLSDSISVQAAIYSLPPAVLLAFLLVWPVLWRARFRPAWLLVILPLLAAPIFWLAATLFELHALANIHVLRRGQHWSVWSELVPDMLRLPVATLAKRVIPNFQLTAYESGWLPADVLRASAIGHSSISAWVGWEKRDPAGALAYSLQIPPVSNFTQPATRHDQHAGYVIGSFGHADDVVKRLTGTYSDAMVNGVYIGIYRAKRAPEFREHAAIAIEEFAKQPQSQQAVLRTVRLWSFVATDDEFMAGFLKRHFDGNTPLSKQVIEHWQLGRGYAMSPAVIEVGLFCNNSIGRQYTISKLRWNCPANKRQWQRIAAIAAGEVAGASNQERIFALETLGQLFSYPQRHQFSGRDVLNRAGELVETARAQIEAMKE